MKYKYMIYGNTGSFQDVINSIYSNSRKCKKFDSLHSVFNFICSHSLGLKIEDLCFRYYGYDVRIDRNVYILLTKRFGNTDYIKLYGTPQFAGYYLVEL